jgi:hypothetical protein
MEQNVKGRSIWAIILKKALVRLQGPYAKEEEEEEEKEEEDLKLLVQNCNVLDTVGCQNSDRFQAKVQCLFTLCALHARKHLSPSCAIQGI